MPNPYILRHILEILKHDLLKHNNVKILTWMKYVKKKFWYNRGAMPHEIW
jgi:hypothetical protein